MPSVVKSRIWVDIETQPCIYVLGKLFSSYAVLPLSWNAPPVYYIQERTRIYWEENYWLGFVKFICISTYVIFYCLFETFPFLALNWYTKNTHFVLFFIIIFLDRPHKTSLLDIWNHITSSQSVDMDGYWQFF